MTIFADTSALIKLFVEEAGTAAMRTLVAGRVVAVSDLASARQLSREGLSVTLACNNARLLAAAVAEGLEVVDPVGA